VTLLEWPKRTLQSTPPNRPQKKAAKAAKPQTAQPKAAKAKKPQPAKQPEPVKKEKEEDAIIEDVPLDESPPPLENAAEAADAQEKGQKLNKNEKKARKAIAKLGLKPFPGINRVTMRKGQDILFIIANPEIYKTANTDTYVIFGDAKIENLSNNQLASKVKEVVENAEPQAEATEEKPTSLAAAAASVAAPEAPKVQVVEDEGPVDETGLSAGDIELLMTQSGVSRARAVRELRATNGDLVTAIMNATEN